MKDINILITNDDGIESSGIRVLVDQLADFYNIYIAAPKTEKSATSHSLTLRESVEVKRVNYPNKSVKKAWAIDGTPTDCVKIAISSLLNEGERPDVLISGINHGPNLGYDVQYSGTVGAAKEASMMGIKAIAISLVAMKPNKEEFYFAGKFAKTILEKIDYTDNSNILNINIPCVKENEIKGISVTKLGGRIFTTQYEKSQISENSFLYKLAGVPAYDPQAEMTDLNAIRNNNISITPISFDLTNYESFKKLNETFNSEAIKI